MKALTLRHPWAFAICYWGKRIENRTWMPPKDMIGQRFAIHGGKAPGKKSSYRAQINLQMEILREHHGWPGAFDEETTWREMLHICVMPGIVATATLREVVPTAYDPWFDNVPGNVGWVLSDVDVLEPIPCNGAQRLWTVPAEIAEKIGLRSAANCDPK